jgi:hypothetical protein
MDQSAFTVVVTFDKTNFLASAGSLAVIETSSSQVSSYYWTCVVRIHDTFPVHGRAPKSHVEKAL